MNIFKNFLLSVALFGTIAIFPAERDDCRDDDELIEALGRSSVALPGQAGDSSILLSQRASGLRSRRSSENNSGLLSSLSSLGASSGQAWTASYLKKTSRTDASSAPAGIGRVPIDPVLPSSRSTYVLKDLDDDFGDLDEQMFSNTDTGAVASLSDSAGDISLVVEGLVLSGMSKDSAIPSLLPSPPSLLPSPSSVSSDDRARILPSVSPASRLERDSEKFLVKLNKQRELCFRCVDRRSFVREMTDYYKMLYKKINSPLDAELFIRRNQEILRDSVAVAMYWRKAFLADEVRLIDTFIQYLRRGLVKGASLDHMKKISAFVEFYGKEGEKGPLAQLAVLQCEVFTKLSKCAALPSVEWNQSEAWLYSREEFNDFIARHKGAMIDFKNIAVRDLERTLKRYQDSPSLDSVVDAGNDQSAIRDALAHILRNPGIVTGVGAAFVRGGVEDARRAAYYKAWAAYYGVKDAKDACVEACSAVGVAVKEATADACSAVGVAANRVRGRGAYSNFEGTCEELRRIKEDQFSQMVIQYCREKDISFNEIELSVKEKMLEEWCRIKAMSTQDIVAGHARPRPFSELGAYRREVTPSQMTQDRADVPAMAAASAEMSVGEFFDALAQLRNGSAC